MTRQPHRITTDQLEGRWATLASAVTADYTQFKRLSGLAGQILFQVARRYTKAEPWEAIYEGSDGAEAVRVYNSLS